MLKVTEIFLSIQGESTFTGLPCIFIRLSGCNLRCSYCDTTYAYEEGMSYTIDKILDEIGNFKPIKLVEITGGEPLLQNEVYDLISALHDKNYNILLETNGSIDITHVPYYVTSIVDVKCPSSGCLDSFLMTNLQEIHKEHDEIKFVLSDRKDYEWALEFVEEHDLMNHKILFSCVQNKLEPSTLAGWIIQDKINVRLQIQLHKLLWHENKKGV